MRIRNMYSQRDLKLGRVTDRRALLLFELAKDKPAIEEFRSLIVKPEPIDGMGCWYWAGKSEYEDYGSFSYKGERFHAHRVARVIDFPGFVPMPETFVCHQCDNPPCVRGSHLFLGDAAINADDMRIKGRGRRAATAEQLVEIRNLHSRGYEPYLIGKWVRLSPKAVLKVIAGDETLPVSQRRRFQ